MMAPTSTSDDSNREKYEYCRIYVSLDQGRTLALLTDIFRATFSRFGHAEDPEGLSVDVRDNEDADLKVANSDFIAWPTTVELELHDDVEAAVILTKASKVLAAIWGADEKAVAACEFEDELPFSGGISRL
ncbi:hypothetical protein ACIRD8_37300 [Streptomyces sp. NPDC102451]|uniref:hypothetical protein n=1 Tax=Streptomyces sp. NPDC102451 TaxID=3366177 RepID=UPI0038268422